MNTVEYVGSCPTARQSVFKIVLGALDPPMREWDFVHGSPGKPSLQNVSSNWDMTRRSRMYRMPARTGCTTRMGLSAVLLCRKDKRSRFVVESLRVSLMP